MTDERQPSDEDSDYPEETSVSQPLQEKLDEPALQRINPESQGGKENLQDSATANTTTLSDSNYALVEQLAFSVPGAKLCTSLAKRRGLGAIEYYQSFEPADAFERTVARLTVGCTNAAMDGLERAAAMQQTGDPRAIELRLVNKTVATVMGLLTLLDKHRGSGRQKISVGSVNVAHGAKAIVGNVHAFSGDQPSADEDDETT